MISVSIPAEDRMLQSIAGLRRAAGLLPTDASQDDYLNEYGLAVSDIVSRACGVADDGLNPPTLLSETIVETVHSLGIQPYRPYFMYETGSALPSLTYLSRDIVLSRRFVTDITSVVEDGNTTDPTDYEFDRASGIIRRFVSGRPSLWSAQKTVITYVAGFAAPPTDLRLAATLEFKTRWSADKRDPYLRSESVEGVGRQDFLVPGGGGTGGVELVSAVSPAVVMMLAPYRTTAKLT